MVGTQNILVLTNQQIALKFNLRAEIYNDSQKKEQSI